MYTNRNICSLQKNYLITAAFTYSTPANKKKRLFMVTSLDNETLTLLSIVYLYQYTFQVIDFNYHCISRIFICIKTFMYH